MQVDWTPAHGGRILPMSSNEEILKETWSVKVEAYVQGSNIYTGKIKCPAEILSKPICTMKNQSLSFPLI